MAVVFISPKQRQRTFFLAITGVLLLFLAIFSISVIPSEHKEVTVKIALNKANIEVNTSIFKQEKFQKLQPVPEMKKQFRYDALAPNGTSREGFLSAENRDEAEEIIKGFGWRVVSIIEVESGRENPFIEY